MRFLRPTVLALALATAGCANDPDSGLRPDLPGVLTAAWLDAHPTRDVQAVYIHGIGCHSPGYSDGFQLRFADAVLADGDEQLDTELAVYVLELMDESPNDRLPPDFRVQRVEMHDYLADDMAKFRSFSFSRARRLMSGGLSARRDKFEDLQQRAMRRACVLTAEGCPDAAATDSPYYRYEARCPLGDNDEDAARVEIQENYAFRDDEESERPPYAFVIERRLARAGAGSTTFYEVLWSPLAQREKFLNLAYETDGGRRVGPDGTSAITPRSRRALINWGSKAFFLNSNVPDAIYYIGAGRNDVQGVIDFALCLQNAPGSWDAARHKTAYDFCRESASTAPDAAVEKMFFTESLGSRTLFDTFLEALAAPPAVGEADDGAGGRPDMCGVLAGAGRDGEAPRIYMFANQLPLLEVAVPDPDAVYRPRMPGAERCPGVDRWAPAPGADPAANHYFTAVAFSDPNDVLSYEMTRDYQQRYAGYVELENYPLQLARPITNLRGRWGLLVWPVAAHRNHAFDDRVLRAVVCGYGEKALPTENCPLD